MSWNSMTVFDARRLAWSALIGAIVAACFAAVWHILDAASLPLGATSGLEILLFMTIIVSCHEGSHLLGFPDAGLGSNTVIGIWPKVAAPYVQYRLPMGRNRFMVTCLLPVLTLSILPLLLVPIGFGSVAYLSWISVLNCVGAGSDIFIFWKLLTAVPADALVLESDGKIHWTRSLAMQTDPECASV